MLCANTMTQAWLSVSNKKKQHWQDICDAVNAVSAERQLLFKENTFHTWEFTWKKKKPHVKMRSSVIVSFSHVEIKLTCNKYPICVLNCYYRSWKSVFHVGRLKGQWSVHDARWRRRGGDGGLRSRTLQNAKLDSNAPTKTIHLLYT